MCVGDEGFQRVVQVLAEAEQAFGEAMPPAKRLASISQITCQIESS